MAGEVVVDALPYIDQGYDDPGVRESVSRNDTGIIITGLVIITVLRKTPQDPIDTMEQEQAYIANSFKSKGVTASSQQSQPITNWHISQGLTTTWPTKHRQESEAVECK